MRKRNHALIIIMRNLAKGISWRKTTAPKISPISEKNCVLKLRSTNWLSTLCRILDIFARLLDTFCELFAAKERWDPWFFPHPLDQSTNLRIISPLVDWEVTRYFPRSIGKLRVDWVPNFSAILSHSVSRIMKNWPLVRKLKH